MAPRKVTQEVLDRVTAELAAAEITLDAAVKAHDLACSMVAADIEVGEISVGDAAARTTATGGQLDRATTLVDRLSRALPELVARLDSQASADAEKSAEKRAAEITKLCDVACAVATELAKVLGAAEELAGTLMLARLQVDGLANEAGAGNGGAADPQPLSGARPLAAHARGTGLTVPPNGFKDEPDWGPVESLKAVLAAGPRRPFEALLVGEQQRIENEARQHGEILAWVRMLPGFRVPQILVRDDLPEAVKDAARQILADAVEAREASLHPADGVSAPEPAAEGVAA